MPCARTPTCKARREILKVAVVPVTPFQQNCSVVVCERTARAAAIDPGGDLDRIDAALQRLGGTLGKVLLTHGHIDHCGQAAEYARRHGVPPVLADAMTR